MARIEITVPGERVTEEFTALVQQPVTPTGAVPVKVGLVEISQQMPTELIAGPMGPQGPRGSRWTTGAGDPTVPGGVVGDMYLDDVSGAVWAWDGTSWIDTGTNIQGSPDTGNDILVKLAPVDGAGSGLDADLLDGQHGAYYLDWDNQTDKPATFPPTLPIPWTDVSGKPATFPPTLPIPSSGITGLDAKQASQDAAIAAIVPFPEAPNDGLTYGRKNLAWATIVGGAVISDTAPPGPLTAGQLWWQSSTGNTYLWFADGDSQQWVQQNVQPAPVPGSPPIGTIRTTIITANTTYTKPAGLKYLEATCYGGGGAGGGAAANAAGAGSAGGSGCGGAKAWSLLAAADITATVAMTIGTGGVAVTGAAGGDGSDTSFGAYVVAAGGKGGGAIASHANERSVGTGATVQSSAGQVRGWTPRGSWSRQSAAGGGSGNIGGNGGESDLGGAGSGAINGNAAASGQPNTGAGGAGITQQTAGAAVPGGNGGSGVILLREFF